MKNRGFVYSPDMTVDEMLRELKRLGYRTPGKKMIKTPEQIAGCREAGRINSLVLDAVASEIKLGMSTLDIDEIVVEKTRELGGIPACLGYEGFPRSVCTSLNSVVCHGIPSKKDVIKEGDILNVDCTTLYEGYYGDASRMFTFGEISDTASRLVNLTREAVEMSILWLAPFTSFLGDIGYVIGSMARAKGFSVVREIGGHGVGLKMHEDPYVCHLGLKGSGIVLVPGMIFTVEPMINQGTGAFIIDEKDGWTVRTADGGLSAQVEYEILITHDSYEILSK